MPLPPRSLVMGHYPPMSSRTPTCQGGSLGSSLSPASYHVLWCPCKVKQQQPPRSLPSHRRRLVALEGVQDRRSRAGRPPVLGGPPCFGRASVASGSTNSWQWCCGGLSRSSGRGRLTTRNVTSPAASRNRSFQPWPDLSFFRTVPVIHNSC